MSYQPPTTVLEVLQQIEFTHALEPDDPRNVETQEARGSQKTLGRLAFKLGLDIRSGQLAPREQNHVLFFGHVGSGKTTELKRYARELEGADRFFVVEVDIAALLDPNNLTYADVLMAVVYALLEKLADAGIQLSSDALKALQNWGSERVASVEEMKDLGMEVKAGASIEGGIPLLVKLFGGFTSAAKTNVSYKNTVRKVIRDSFTQFASAFNELARDVEARLAETGLGRRLLFIIDGTDKLRGDDMQGFFIDDAEQLLQIRALVIYTAPLHLKYRGNLTNRLDADLVLPMIKLFHEDGSRHEPGWATLRDLLLRRADRALFAADADIDRLVEHCGGHPRELLRLLQLCCEFTEQNRIDAATVESAIRQLASEYRRFLEPEDYSLLARLDTDTVHAGNDERTRKLLYNLALLEYNDGSWRRSHPVVRALDGYQRAAHALSPSA